MEAIKTEGLIKARQRIKEYKASLPSYDLCGADLTDDVKLLSGNFALTKNDLSAILERSEGNRTMERLVHDYAKSHKITMDKAFVSVEEKARDADGLINYVQSVCDRPSFYEMMDSDEYIEEAISDSIRDD